MKYIAIILLLLALLGCQEIPDSHVIDNFRGSTTLNKSWWRFGDIKSFIGRKDTVNNFVRVLGKAENWYVGGMGKYLGLDGNDYNSLAFHIKGNSASPTTLKIQIYGDDNGDYTVEQDTKFKPLHDDLFEHTLEVDWNEWRYVIIPFQSFIDMNPDIGDNELSRLMQIQMIFNATSEQGNVDLSIASMKFIKNDKL